MPQHTPPTPRPCFACTHLHDPNSAGQCWQAECLPQCTATPACPRPEQLA